MEGVDWKMVMNNDQIWTLVMGILFALSEIMGMVKVGPNGILHGAWKFYNLKVDLEYDFDGEVIENENNRVEQTQLPDRETIVLEALKSGDQPNPNVLLIGNKNEN